MKNPNTENTNEYITLAEACEILQISVATGRNWIRQGRWTPVGKVGRTTCFLRRDVEELVRRVQEGSEEVLRSRRNKSRISGRLLYDKYVSANCQGRKHVKQLLELLPETVDMDESWIRCILADAALHMLVSLRRITFLNECPEESSATDRPVDKEDIIVQKEPNELEDTGSSSYLQRFLDGQLRIEDTACRIFLQDLIPDGVMDMVRDYPKLFAIPYIYEERQDILGLIYMSCREQGSRKKSGAYYTPTKIVQRMVRRLLEDSVRQSRDILDPCCGTGNFLLQLPDWYPLESIYGNDLDEVSILVARLNLAMRHPGSDPNLIRSHITCCNYLTEYPEEKKFDYIIGNPPWGIQWTPEEREELRPGYRTIQTSGRRQAESADVFLEKMLRCVGIGGRIALVMPESVLHVQSHQEIRRLMMECIRPEFLEYAGELFRGVQCPSILLQVCKTGQPMKIQGLQVIHGAEHFTVNKERNPQEEDLLLHIRDEEYELLQKLAATPNAEYLKGQAEFALGIVTGDNARWVREVEDEASSEANHKENPGCSEESDQEWETILRGSDIQSYRMNPSNLEIIFRPELFQQVAPERFYRAPEKLVYRFIADHPIVAWDPNQTLTLNSGNILIPLIPDMDMRYIMAVLNSRIIRFYYKKRFRSVKVLRSYLEQLPIPRVDSARMHRVTDLANARMQAVTEEEIARLESQLEEIMKDIFHITEEEYAWILREG